MLIVFGGLPGTGKTTIARLTARRRFATYLRIDDIEQAMRNSGISAKAVGTAGYGVANALAEANLALGRAVVADCVNPVRESRESWHAVASRHGARLFEIQVVCSDPEEHRRRVEGRASDIPGLLCPTWRSVLEHEYEPWDAAHLTLDTAVLSPDEAVSALELHIGS